MIDYFIVGRVIALFETLLISLGVLGWMLAHKQQALYGVPILAWSVHGMFYLLFYLYFHTYPAPPFTQQFFLNWESTFSVQAYTTAALIVWDVRSGWFSFRFLPWMLEHSKTLRLLV